MRLGAERWCEKCLDLLMLIVNYYLHCSEVSELLCHVLSFEIG